MHRALTVRVCFWWPGNARDLGVAGASPERGKMAAAGGSGGGVGGNLAGTAAGKAK
jgi:hypothetical protein